MATKVVLVRHGIAEARTSVFDDFSRKLTRRGEEALEEYYRMPEFFPSLASDGEGDGTIEVMASPATRTMQTAKVICSVLGMPEDSIVCLDTLWNQDVSGIEEAIHSAKGTVVVVGHSPSMDDVASYFSGRLRMMMRGEALCIGLGIRGSRGTVLWDCRPR